MKALIQRVTQASVSVDTQVISEIGKGLLVLLGVEKNDTTAAVGKMADKLLQYRIFADGQNKMNCNVQEVDGGLLVVSQFTLVANTQKGLRPSFASAAAPDIAEQIYEQLVTELKARYKKIATGRFAANMQVSLINDGPVTFLLEV